VDYHWGDLFRRPDGAGFFKFIKRFTAEGTTGVPKKDKQDVVLFAETL
jgi:hypothetical protein